MKFHEEKLSAPSINLLPILDCLFILIFVFMFSILNTSQRKGLNLKLPIAATAKPLPAVQILTIEILKQDLFIQNRKVSQRELEKELEFLSLEMQHPSLIIKGERDTPLGTTIKILDLVKKHGFNDVTIETSKN